MIFFNLYLKITTSKVNILCHYFQSKESAVNNVNSRKTEVSTGNRDKDRPSLTGCQYITVHFILDLTEQVKTSLELLPLLILTRTRIIRVSNHHPYQPHHFTTGSAGVELGRSPLLVLTDSSTKIKIEDMDHIQHFIQGSKPKVLGCILW